MKGGGRFPLSLIDWSSEGGLINHRRSVSSTFPRVLLPLLTSSCDLRSILVPMETHADGVTASNSSNGQRQQATNRPKCGRRGEWMIYKHRQTQQRLHVVPREFDVISYVSVSAHF